MKLIGATFAHLRPCWSSRMMAPRSLVESSQMRMMLAVAGRVLLHVGMCPWQWGELVLLFNLSREIILIICSDLKHPRHK